jgi:hypothetical protein
MLDHLRDLLRGAAKHSAGSRPTRSNSESRSSSTPSGIRRSGCPTRSSRTNR